jgi:AcrR family transcriptional regulator
MEKKKNAKVAQGELTVLRMLSVARDLFSIRSFAEVSTEEIVQKAAITRGALYHHFGGKDELFISVFETIQTEIAERVVAAASVGKGLWPDFLSGCRAFLESCLDPRIQRIVFVEAPSVLGWERWRAADAANSLAALKEGLSELMSAGLIRKLPVDPLAHLLSGAMNEAALWIAAVPDPQTALEQSMSALEALLGGVKETAEPGKPDEKSNHDTN